MNWTKEEWKEFDELNNKFREKFEDIIPLMIIQDDFASLKKNVEKCFTDNKNLLAEIYDIKYDGSRIY